MPSQSYGGKQHIGYLCTTCTARTLYTIDALPWSGRVCWSAVDGQRRGVPTARSVSEVPFRVRIGGSRVASVTGVMVHFLLSTLSLYSAIHVLSAGIGRF